MFSMLYFSGGKNKTKQPPPPKKNQTTLYKLDKQQQFRQEEWGHESL